MYNPNDTFFSLWMKHVSEVFGTIASLLGALLSSGLAVGLQLSGFVAGLTCVVSLWLFGQCKLAAVASMSPIKALLKFIVTLVLIPAFAFSIWVGFGYYTSITNDDIGHPISLDQINLSVVSLEEAREKLDQQLKATAKKKKQKVQKNALAKSKELEVNPPTQHLTETAPPKATTEPWGRGNILIWGDPQQISAWIGAVSIPLNVQVTLAAGKYELSIRGNKPAQTKQVNVLANHTETFDLREMVPSKIEAIQTPAPRKPQPPEPVLKYKKKTERYFILP